MVASKYTKKYINKYNTPTKKKEKEENLDFFIHSDFHWTLIRPAASASEVTTVWRYRNSIIIIIIIILRQSKYSSA